MKIAREETFGPVAPVFRFSSEQEAVELANATEFGLAAYFFAGDVSRVWRVGEQLEFGIVGVNTGAFSYEGAPFGGYKESGIGREGSHHGIDEFLEIKYLCLGAVRPAPAELTSAARRPDGDRGTTFVQSLERGLAVIRTFEHGSASTPSEVAAATGLTRAAARRFLLTLADLGYVRAEGRAFRLSPRVLELGRAYLSGLTLPDLALPHLRELVASVRESSSVAVLDGERIVYIAHVAAKRVLARDGDGRRRRIRLRDVARPRAARRAERRVARPVPGAGGAPALTARTITERGGFAPSSRRCGSRGGRSSTRSWRWGCGPWRRRSTTRTAGWSRR